MVALYLSYLMVTCHYPSWWRVLRVVVLGWTYTPLCRPYKLFRRTGFNPNWKNTNPKDCLAWFFCVVLFFNVLLTSWKESLTEQISHCFCFWFLIYIYIYIINSFYVWVFLVLREGTFICSEDVSFLGLFFCTKKGVLFFCCFMTDILVTILSSKKEFLPDWVHNSSNVSNIWNVRHDISGP